MMQQLCCSIIKAHNPELMPGEIESISMGRCGVDIIKHSQQAKDMIPFAIECKSKEKLNIWADWEQAKKYETLSESPLLLFKRSRSEVLATLNANVLFSIARKAYLYEKSQGTK